MLNGSEWVAIAGIVAGTVGTLTGALGGPWLQDHRRYNQEARLRSGDDLLGRIDEVLLALEDLAKAAVELRSMAFTYGADASKIGPTAQATNDAYQRARFSIARLGVRPHADVELVDKATAAAKAFLLAWDHAWKALAAGQHSTGSITLLAQIPDQVEKGYKAQREFEQSAQRLMRELAWRP